MILSKSHNNLTKLKQKTSCIYGKAFQLITHMALDGNCISPRNFILFLYFCKEQLRISSITQEKIIATLFSHIITHNNLDSNSAFCYPQVSSLRFELATKLKTQAEHKVVTRHMKETNGATIHHLNKEKLHLLTTHTGKQVNIFGFLKVMPIFI